MTRVRKVLAWLAGHPLAVCLPLQAALLFHNLALLPAWGDELHTLTTAPLPLGTIAGRIAHDIHPPLYFFSLHWWLELPLPGILLVRARAFSALWLLAGTVIVYRLWVWNRERRRTAWWFMALWTLSPCLLLYGRMARSYSMQLALASLAIYCGLRFLREPRSRAWQVASGAAIAALMYTHYSPGAAVSLGIASVAAWRAFRTRDGAPLEGVVVVSVLALAFYSPWLLTLRIAAAKWGIQPHVYTLAGNRLGDQLLKLTCWFGSFAFGETLPAAAIILGLVLAPLVGWLLWRGMRTAPEWLPLAVAAAAIGFVGATRWVTYPFMPARMLFVFPFFLLLIIRGCDYWPRTGTAVCLAMALVALASMPSYYSKSDFFNKGYAAPLDEMAALVNHDSTPGALVAIDAFNMDAYPLRARLDGNKPVVLLKWRGAFNRVANCHAPAIWYLRNGHDTTPEWWNTRLEADLVKEYRVQRHLFQPYSWLEKFVIRCAGWPDRPTHFFEVLELRRKAGR